MCYSIHGDSLQAMKYAESAFEAAEKIEDVELLATIGWELCVTYSTAGEYLKITEIAPRVIALLEETQKQYGYFGKYYNFNLYSALLAYQGNSLGTLGNFEEGEAFCEKALHFAIEQDNIYSLTIAEQQYGFLYLTRGDGENAIEHIRNSEKYAEQGQATVMKPHISTGLGLAYYLLGEIETALKHLERSLEMRRTAEFSILASIHYYILSLVHLDLGDIKKAQSYITEALELAQNRNEKGFEGCSRILLGRILGKKTKKQFAQAEESILQGITIVEELKTKPWSTEGYLFLGELYADIGQREKAMETLKEAEAAFQEMGMDYWLRRTQEVLERVQA